MSQTKRARVEKTRRPRDIAVISITNHSSYPVDFFCRNFLVQLVSKSEPVNIADFDTLRGWHPDPYSQVALMMVEKKEEIKSIHYDLKENADILAIDTTHAESSLQAYKDKKEIMIPSLVSRCQVVDKDEVVLVDNPKNPALTMEERYLVRKEILRLREHCIPCKEMWESICKLLQRKDPNLLIKSYGLQEQDYHPEWREIYEPLVPIIGTNDDLEGLLKGPITLHAYWRAFERYPGAGDASFFTIRYAFQLYPTTTSEEFQKNHVQVKMVENAEGENILCGPFVPTSVQSMQGLHGKIRELILAQTQRDATYHIVDTTSRDMTARDTEWSSVEFLVFSAAAGSNFDLTYADVSIKKAAKTFLLACNRCLPKHARLHSDLFTTVMSFVVPARPIFRLHQECLLGPQYGDRSEYHRQARVVEGTAEQQEMIGFMTQLVGMGRVCQLDCDEGMLQDLILNHGSAPFEPSRAADELSSFPRNTSLGHGYEFPIIFR